MRWRQQPHLRNVQRIQAASSGSFAAILESGAVVTWGRRECGGDSSQVQEQLMNVPHIQATEASFAALLESGAVVTWGVLETGAVTTARCKSGRETSSTFRQLPAARCKSS